MPNLEPFTDGNADTADGGGSSISITGARNPEFQRAHLESRYSDDIIDTCCRPWCHRFTGEMWEFFCPMCGKKLKYHEKTKIWKRVK